MFNKTALIGTGYWGTILAKHLPDNGFEVVDTFSYEKATRSLSDILADAEIEVAVIATNTGSHYDLCKQFLLAGKHVFCEKPLTETFATAQELYSIAEQVNRTLFVDWVYLYSPSIVAVKERVGAEVEFIEMRMGQYGRFYNGENVLSVIGSHLLSIYFSFVDNSDYRVDDLQFYSAVMPPEANSPTQVSITLSANTCKARIHCSLISPVRDRDFRFYTKNQIVRFAPLENPSVQFFANGTSVLTEHFNETGNLNFSLKAFYHDIESGILCPHKQITLNVASVLEQANGKI